MGLLVLPAKGNGTAGTSTKFKIAFVVLILIILVQTYIFQWHATIKFADCSYTIATTSMNGDRPKQKDIAIVPRMSTSLIKTEEQLQHQNSKSLDEKKENHPSAKQKQKPLIAIVTGFSQNHYLEGVTMLRSLVNTNYTGLLYIYILRGKHERSTATMVSELSNEIYNNTNLNAKIINYELWTPFNMYCFKPSLINDFIMTSALEDKLPKVLMWSDASTRFRSNPEDWAKHMIDDDVDFSIGPGGLEVVNGTYHATFEYLGKDPELFRGKKEFRAGHFLVNMVADGGAAPAERDILRPYLHCGTRACRDCMAPKGSVQGPLSSPNLHRQDQSVMSLLTHDFIMHNRGNVVIGGKDKDMTYHKYFDLHCQREPRAKSVKCISDDSECLFDDEFQSKV